MITQACNRTNVQRAEVHRGANTELALILCDVTTKVVVKCCIIVSHIIISIITKVVDNNVLLNELHCAMIMVKDTGSNPLSGANH